MITKSFTLKKFDFEVRPITIFQHKLRALMKCYVVRDLILDEIKQTIKFKKSHRINGMIMQDPKEYLCKYEIEETKNPKEINLKIII